MVLLRTVSCVFLSQHVHCNIEECMQACNACSIMLLFGFFKGSCHFSRCCATSRECRIAIVNPCQAPSFAPAAAFAAACAILACAAASADGSSADGGSGGFALYSCLDGQDHFTSTQPNCEGFQRVELLGTTVDPGTAGTLPLYRCFDGLDHLDSSSGQQLVAGPITKVAGDDEKPQPVPETKEGGGGRRGNRSASTTSTNDVCPLGYHAEEVLGTLYLNVDTAPPGAAALYRCHDAAAAMAAAGRSSLLSATTSS